MFEESEFCPGCKKELMEYRYECIKWNYTSWHTNCAAKQAVADLKEITILLLSMNLDNLPMEDERIAFLEIKTGTFRKIKEWRDKHNGNNQIT